MNNITKFEIPIFEMAEHFNLILNNTIERYLINEMLNNKVILIGGGSAGKNIAQRLDKGECIVCLDDKNMRIAGINGAKAGVRMKEIIENLNDAKSIPELASIEIEKLIYATKKLKKTPKQKYK